MLKDLKYRLTTGWDFMRVLRALLALFVLVFSFIQGDTLLMLAGGFLTGQAALNVGCCGVDGCNVSPQQPSAKTAIENSVHFEEIKEK